MSPAYTATLGHAYEATKKHTQDRSRSQLQSAYNPIKGYRILIIASSSSGHLPPPQLSIAHRMKPKTVAIPEA